MKGDGGGVLKPGGRLPNVIIIGAYKCGTSSLHYYLNRHPQIFMSKEKELNFFIEDRNWFKGAAWYKGNFKTNMPVRGETTPNYAAYPRIAGVPRRMHAVIPEAKLIYLVRDPLERIKSMYTHSFSTGYDSRKFSEILQPIDDANIYIATSRYHMQLCQYLKYYAPKQILVVSAEDLRENRKAILQKIFGFLDVAEDFYDDRFEREKHVSAIKGKKNRLALFLKHMAERTFLSRVFSTDMRMEIGSHILPYLSRKMDPPVYDRKLRDQVIAYLQDDIDRFRRLTGHTFDQWCL